jgi:hypothetical protein
VVVESKAPRVVVVESKAPSAVVVESRLQVQQLTQLYTTTDCIRSATFCTILFYPPGRITTGRLQLTP